MLTRRGLGLKPQQLTTHTTSDIAALMLPKGPTNASLAYATHQKKAGPAVDWGFADHLVRCWMDIWNH